MDKQQIDPEVYEWLHSIPRWRIAKELVLVVCPRTAWRIARHLMGRP